MRASSFQIFMVVMMALMATSAHALFPQKSNYGFHGEGILNESEIESLKKMREEEMLAHDVYSTFAELYSIPVFRNISKSEKRHTESIEWLLDEYGVEDPAHGHERGVFTDPHFQELYEDLIGRGRKSLAEAIKVGLFIEDMDIADLETALAEEVVNEDIKFVYGNLLRASKIHMKAFYAHASGRGLTYDPVYISESQFVEIVGDE